MSQGVTRDTGKDPHAFLPGTGEMVERTRALDWSKTPVGPVGVWPQSLKTAVRIVLGSRYQMALWWGRGLTNFYNDAYISVLGQRHPHALGQPAAVVWSEIWDTLGPQTVAVMDEGRATWNEEQLLIMERNGFPEETYFTYSYSPVPDDGGGVGGLLITCTEDTHRVLSQRRLRTLRELAARTTEGAKSAEDACRIAVRTLAGNSFDLPFTLVYLLDDEGKAARLAGAAGLPDRSPAAPPSVDLAETAGESGWPLGEVLRTGRAEVVSELGKRFGSLPGGAWPEPTRRAVVVPMAKPGQTRPAGFVVAGVSPRLVFTDDYKGFLELLAGHVATAVSNARAYEEERRRAEALAELDRAKTAFFSNVSHEFRTPLTLMLGPVEELLLKRHTDLSPAATGQLEVVNRNGLRLLRLVNSLLDFSRIEAGRVRATYQPTDLPVFTADLASVFRAAVERAGLRLVVDCPPLGEPVFVDRDMWEKVVLNLLSNAFKFTFDGEIAVSLRRSGGAAELRVRDTGTGIPAEEMPRLFERFHRVQHQRGRTHEGSGIGLALVQELVKLHGGSVAAESTVGEGTTFAVTVPLGSAHLPPDQIGDSRPAALTGGGATPYVEEALRWLPSEEKDEGGRMKEDLSRGDAFRVHPSSFRLHPPDEDDTRPRVLVADDNADMRQYVARLLAEQFRVRAVPDGEAALAAAREQPPDLVLTDVMMPRLDGFGLLRELRADPRTSDVPIILLSARAGEESRVEGMGAGADDYLVKPFSARELLARVSAHLQLSRLRREANESLRESEGRLRMALTAARMVAWSWSPAEDKVVASDNIAEVYGLLPGTTVETAGQGFPLVHPDDRERHRATVLAAVERCERYVSEFRIVRPVDGSVLWMEEQAHAYRGPDGAVRLAGVVRDVTERQRAGEALRESEATLRAFYDNAPVFMGVVEPTGDGDVLHVYDNPPSCRFFGVEPGATANRRALADLGGDPGVVAEWLARYRQSGEAGGPVRFEHRFEATSGPRWLAATVCPVGPGPSGRPRFCYVAEDVTDRRRADDALRESERRFRQLADAMPQIVYVTEAGGRVVFANRQWLDYTGQPAAQPADLAPVVHPDDMAGMLRRWEQAQAAGATFQAEFRLRRASDGEYRWFLTRAVPVRDGGGRVTHWYGTSTDIHDQKRIEAALQEADRKKDDFLALLAHELRNPLAPIRNGLHVLRLAGADGEAAAEARSMMERQLSQLVRIVDDLLDVSRITRNKLELRKERVDLAAVIRSAVETSRPLIDEQGHALTVALPREPLPLDADLTRLAQVFANLLNNSAKYTPPKGRIRLAAELASRAASPPGDEVVVTVQDNGIGIPEASLRSIFDMFSQVDRTLEKTTGGLGIGLSLVKGLVEMHGGAIEAKSDGADKGSTFVVRLPLAAGRPRPEPQAAGQGENVAPRRRVLVVDDNRDGANSLAMMLKIMGNETRTAHDGLEAVALAESFRPDVILMDIGMPRLNGFDACRRIREQPWGEGIVVVAQTGWGQEEDKQKSQDSGFDFHMVKPVDPAALEKLLSEMKAR